MQLVCIAMVTFAWAWMLLSERPDSPVHTGGVDVDDHVWRSLRDRLAVPWEELIDPEREEAGE